jgi:hypothetical protein
MDSIDFRSQVNNGIQFNLELPFIQERLDELTDIVEALGDYESFIANPPTIFQSKLGKEFVDLVEALYYFGFTVYIESVQSKSLIMYSDDWGWPELAAQFIQLLLVNKLIFVDDYVLLTWAEQSNKTVRTNEFSGGACMITEDVIYWHQNPQDWAEALFQKPILYFAE